MRAKGLLFFAALMFTVSAQAMECPTHLAKAQQQIDKVAADMKEMKMDQSQKALVHALLDDAKMYLASAKHNHKKPQGAYDHARSIAKAEAAYGYALSADLLHVQYMNK